MTTTVAEWVDLLEADTADEGRRWRELIEPRPLSPEVFLSTREEQLAMWRIRRRTTASAGIRMTGFDRLEQNLVSLPRTAEVVTAAFETKDCVANIFGTAQPLRLLGVLVTPKR